MANNGTSGCCTGIGVETPAGKSNAPGLSAISYRVGDWSRFNASMLSRLSSGDFPALAGLTTRSDSDFTIALCDAFSAMADVVTFYQERIANENYLRTATQRNSVVEMANLIGYQPTPGVAASANLAFTMQATPGQPALSPQPSTIPVGTRVQSMPDPGQMPQTFETVGAATARLEWNNIPVQTSVTVPIQPGLTGLYLAGTATQLSQGDAILIMGDERETDTTSMRWDVRWIETVVTDTPNNLTHVTWTDGLSDVWSTPSASGIKIFALRQRAALFGNNAPNPLLMNLSSGSGNGNNLATGDEWTNFVIDTTGQNVDLDGNYPKIVKGSWLALTGGIEIWRTIGAADDEATLSALRGNEVRY